MNESIKRRNIVARVLAAENKSEAIIAEAKRAGKSTRTIERWVENAQKAAPVRQDVVSPNVVPPGKPAENPVLDTLLKEEGQPGKEPQGPPTEGELRTALKDQEEFVLDIFNSAKSAGGSVLVGHRYSPPLDPMDPAILSLLKFGKVAETAIRANAPRLYPILMQHASTWSALILAVGSDALATFGALEGLAKSKGWTPTKRKEAERAARAEVPSREAYAAQLRPVPPASDQAEHKKGEETVVNAPMPTPEDIQNFNNVSRAMGGPQLPVPVAG